MDDDAADLENITIVPIKSSPESSSLMYFDLDTTGFQRTSDIVQIAAVCGEKSINIYLKPNGRISEGASKVLWNHLNSRGPIFVDCEFFAYSWGCNFVDVSVFSFSNKDNSF